MKILIVEDKKKPAQIVKKGLEKNAFTVDLSLDGEEGLHKLLIHTVRGAGNVRGGDR